MLISLIRLKFRSVFGFKAYASFNIKTFNMLLKEWRGNTSLLFRIKGSVIFTIWPQVLFGVLYSVAIVSFHKYSGYPISDFPATFIPDLGLVIGLLLVFRTTTGYDRYYEGRKLWSDMTYTIRTLARCSWLGVKDECRPEGIIEKRTAINLLVAFAFATKNYLRGEYSYDADVEIKRLTLHLPRFQDETKENGLSTSGVTKTEDVTKNGIESFGKLSGEDVSLQMQLDKAEYNHAKNRKPAIGQQPLQDTMSERKKIKRTRPVDGGFNTLENKFQAHDTVTPTNIPMELVYYYQTWVYKVTKEENVDGETAKIMLNFSNELMNILAQLERILRTPIPLAYSIHLRQSIWLYMLTLPFQVVNQLGWITVPGMALAYFALLGILAIGGEIENPFGYDDNDLPLDEFCEVIQHEVAKFADQKFPHPDTWVFNQWNIPFKTQSQMSALELKSIGESAFHS